MKETKNIYSNKWERRKEKKEGKSLKNEKLMWLLYQMSYIIQYDMFFLAYKVYWGRVK